MNENDKKENSLINKLEDIDNSGCEVIKEFNNEPEEIKIERVKDNKTYDRSIKIILIGKSKVGKTSINIIYYIFTFMIKLYSNILFI